MAKKSLARGIDNRDRLDDLIKVIRSQTELPSEVFQAFKTVQGFGNYGSHFMRKASPTFVASVVKSSVFALSALVEWYFEKYVTTMPASVTELQDMKSDTELALAVSFIRCGYLSADSDWSSRQAAVAAYDPKTAKFIWRSEHRSAMNAPKRDYDEITLQCRVKNIGKKSVERFKLVLQAPDASFATESYFNCSEGEQTPLFPGIEIQIPSQAIELRLPLEVPSLDLNWSVFLDDSLPCVGEFRVIKPG